MLETELLGFVNTIFCKVSVYYQMDIQQTYSSGALLDRDERFKFGYERSRSWTVETADAYITRRSAIELEFLVSGVSPL